MRTHDGRAVPNCATQAIRGEPITVYGDGSQTRSLCFVDDLVEGILRLLASDEVLPVNIGNQEEITMLALAEAVRAASGSSSAIEHRELPVAHPPHRCPDTPRPREILAGGAKVPLSGGLPPPIGWFRSQLV